jgi:hypothetical protein
MGSIIVRTRLTKHRGKGVYMLGEFIGNNPGDHLTLNLSLVINPFDRKKTFPQTLGLYHIMLKLGAEAFTIAGDSGIDAVEGGKIGEEK